MFSCFGLHQTDYFYQIHVGRLHYRSDIMVISANAMDKISTHHRRHLLDGWNLLPASPFCLSRDVRRLYQ